MQLSDLYSNNLLELILLIMLLVYFPYAMYQLYLICYSLWMTDKDIMLKHKPLLEPNNVIVTVTTNGMATDVVEKIIKKIRHYDIVSEIFVVKEERDKFTYSCKEIVVPEGLQVQEQVEEQDARAAVRHRGAARDGLWEGDIHLPSG